MHDHNGVELMEGDVVLVPMVVRSVQPTPDHCNVTLDSVYGRKPDGHKECLTCNTSIVVLHERPTGD